MYLKTTYAALVKAFGKPNEWDARNDAECKPYIDARKSAYGASVSWDGKVVVEWLLRFDPSDSDEAFAPCGTKAGDYLRVYDYKATKAYENYPECVDSIEQVDEWHLAYSANHRVNPPVEIAEALVAYINAKNGAEVARIEP